jgi:hypothetical protein
MDRDREDGRIPGRSVKDEHMRIGTWNLDAGRSAEHLRVIDELNCDIWLLTEVPGTLMLDSGSAATSTERMARGQYFALAWSRASGRAIDISSPATAAIEAGGVSYYSSVLPWRTCGPDWAWEGGDQASRTVDTLESLNTVFGGNTVWGGDWNQTMTGPNYGGTRIGRAAIDELLTRHDMALPTRDLPHRQPGMTAIDHIAVPRRWRILNAERIPVPKRLSDHDAYVVETGTD